VTSFTARYQGGPRDGQHEERDLWPTTFHRVPPRTILVPTYNGVTGQQGDIVYRNAGEVEDGAVLYVCEDTP